MNKTNKKSRKMILLSKNLELLRKKKGISQAELAKILEVKPNSISNYENGVSQPNYELLKKIVDYYGVNGHDLLYSDLSDGEANSSFLIKSNVKPLNIANDFAQIPIVDISMAAGEGYLNHDYMTKEDFIVLPNLMVKQGKEYLCGTIKGDSMHPTLQTNSYLIIRRLEVVEWQDIKDGYIYVLSTKDGRTFVKRLRNRLKEKGFVVCCSDNPDKMGYPNFNLEFDELNTVWYAEWYLSAKMPNIQDTYYRKQSELEDRMNEMSSEFEQIKRTLKSANN